MFDVEQLSKTVDRALNLPTLALQAKTLAHLSRVYPLAIRDVYIVNENFRNWVNDNKHRITEGYNA